MVLMLCDKISLPSFFSHRRKRQLCDAIKYRARICWSPNDVWKSVGSKNFYTDRRPPNSLHTYAWRAVLR